VTHVTDVAARTAKISMPVADGDFPTSVIPAKGVPGSAKARILLRLRTPDGIELVAEVAPKNLQRALETSQAAPGGFWVAQGRLASGGVLAEAGVIYQLPAAAKAGVAVPE